MCLQFSETFPHLPFPVLITGSYDRTARIWNLETGQEIRCLKGHTRALRALQFDEVKLVTGSMDHTLRIWNWRTGECISTLEGHTDGVVCLDFDATLLASGSVDTTVKVWNFRTRECFTLRGHRDWVNAVLLWDSNSGTAAAPSSVPDTSSSQSQQHVPPGKMLFSASDDRSVRLWDLTLRTCVRQFSGHMGHVQSLRLLSLDPCNPPTEDAVPKEKGGLCDKFARLAAAAAAAITTVESRSHREVKKPQQLLVSGSLDNTVKLWDIDSGKVVRTLFGHLEGVWAVACNKMRIVSGSHDRTIKVRKLVAFENVAQKRPNFVVDLEPRGRPVRGDACRSYRRRHLPRSWRRQNCLWKRRRRHSDMVILCMINHVLFFTVYCTVYS
jgi:F-box/WD-40 domain protein MET30